MSLQTGKPWMIDRSDFIESVCEWRKHPQAIANDKTLAAMVTLRLAGGNVLEIFTPQRPTAGATNSSRSDSLLKALTAQIEAWKKHWLQPGSDEGENYGVCCLLNPLTPHVGKCHAFIVSFFGSHLLLLLYSFPLENSISSPSGVSFLDMEAFSVTYSSATEMLRLVSQSSMIPMLTYAHDSVHAMTAYAAVFLIKVSKQKVDFERARS